MTHDQNIIDLRQKIVHALGIQPSADMARRLFVVDALLGEWTDSLIDAERDRYLATLDRIRKDRNGS